MLNEKVEKNQLERGPKLEDVQRFVKIEDKTCRLVLCDVVERYLCTTSSHPKLIDAVSFQNVSRPLS